MAVASKEEVRELYEVLPKLNCGLCGFGNCGQFARAVTKGEASPFGCRQNPWVGYRISQIIGAKVPAFGYRYGLYQPLSAQRARPSPSPQSLRQEVGGLSRMVDDILARIEKSGRRES